MSWRKERILITGATGMVGHALHKELLRQGCDNISAIGSAHSDLKELVNVKNLFRIVRPKYVFHLAAKVYGIGGNALHKADVLFDNVMINTNVIEASRLYGVEKIVAMGSGCVYPEINNGKDLREDQIWLGEPHSSENSYAHAKRLMLAQLQANKEQYDMDYAFAISGNLYGEYDKFEGDNGHIIPALISKFYHAKINMMKVIIWGSGIAIRDFSYSADTARALTLLMDKAIGPINTGSGFIHPIKDIVDILQDITGVSILWDGSKPDGQLERYYNLDKLKSLGFEPQVDLNTGLRKVYSWYVENAKSE